MKDFDRTLWDKVVAFHGHECPGLAMGFRGALSALSHLAATRSEDEELVAVAETDACGLDAVQVLTGCSLGKGNLILKNLGKQAFSLLDRKTGKGIRVYVDPERLGVDRNDRAGRTLAILTAPEETLCTITPAEVALPPKAQIFQSAVCTSCGERMAEPKARLRNGNVVCLTCAGEYSRGDW